MSNAEALKGFHLNVLVHGQKGPEHKSPVPTIAVTKGITEKGNTFIQLRDKGMSDQDMISLGIKLRQSLPPEIPLIINDRVAVALAIKNSMQESGIKGVLGLHIGQKDMSEYSTKEISELLGDDIILGVSAATVEEAKQAVEDGADYLGVGPIFPTGSKSDADPPIGLRGLEEIRAAFPETPIIAIGGISTDNAEAVMRFGANGVAVISAVLDAQNPMEAAGELAEIVTPQERIPRLDSNGVFIDQADNQYGQRSMSRKEAETTGNSPVVSVLLFREQNGKKEILLQKRALHKSRWAGQWEGSIVETGRMKEYDPWELEHPSETGERGLFEELTVKNVVFDSKSHFQKFEDTSHASSIMTVYTADYDEKVHGRIEHNTEEVAQVEWVPTEQLLEMVEANSRDFTPGFSEFVQGHPELFN